MVNPDGWGELIGLRLVSSGSELNSARFNLQATPLRYGWKVGLTAASTHYELGDAFADLDANGRARTLGLYGLYPLRRAQRANAYVQLLGEYKDLEDRVLGDTTQKNSRSAGVVLSADHRDQWLGGGVSSYSLALSAGELDIDSAAARALDASTARSHGSFSKAGLSLLRLQRVSERVALYAGASAQWSDGNLDSSEKFALGGANAVRAYPQGEAIGDRGYLATVELRYRLPTPVLGGEVDLLAFYDHGEVKINARPWLPGDDNKRRLSGAGVGATFASRGGFFARLNVAAKTGSEDAVSDADKDVRAWVQLVKRF
jgi:hemolysin activation/secretion protein